MSAEKKQTKTLASIAATALVVFCLLLASAVEAFCLIEHGTGCGDSCSENDECGIIEDIATGRCVMTTDAATEPSGLFCRDDAELIEDRAAEGAVAAAESDATSASQDAIPDLAINIPGLELAQIRKSKTADGMYQIIEIPWLADYIVGAYRYAIFLGGILSVVMVMIGGLQWLTAGGNSSQIGTAKKRITSAVVGLLLILGSFLILS
ncbi:MAG: hypothetical protein U9Q07_08685, partial [Planctomycetota bacterium]|nr:hypothetical protein [Planctomycetota bacterium]